MQEYYEILGVSENATDEEVAAAYQKLKDKYSRERFYEGEAGNEAARNLTKVETAYSEITADRKLHNNASDRSAEDFTDIEKAIKNGNLSAAQSGLDDITDRNAEWHYLQSVVFYKKNWINESKKQLELAIQIDGNCQKYKDALKKLNEKAGSEQKINPDWNKSGNSVYSGDDDAQQLGGDSCAEWCCKMAICNFLLNCCCNCR